MTTPAPAPTLPAPALRPPGRRGAAALATGALACAACCALPFALPAVMLAGTGSVLAWAASARPWLMALAVAGVAAGWLWVALQSRRSQARPARATLSLMGAASVMLLLAILWPALS